MMKETDLVKNKWTPWARAIAVAVLGFCLASCANNSSTVPEAEYSTEIVGRWQGTVGDLKETMSIDADGTFVCQLYPTGFIANTLSQGVKGTVRGTWEITGAMVTLKITDEKKERLENRTAASTIVAFKKDELVLKSDRGGTSPFQRVRAL
jgi:hypothetical protein